MKVELLAFALELIDVFAARFLGVSRDDDGFDVFVIGEALEARGFEDVAHVMEIKLVAGVRLVGAIIVHGIPIIHPS